MFEGLGGTIVTFLLAAGIIYLSYICSKYIGKGISRGGRSGYMRLVDQMPVGQNRTVAIVQVGGRYFVLGIASEQIQLLTELEEEDLIPIAAGNREGSTPDFGEVLARLRKKKE